MAKKKKTLIRITDKGAKYYSELQERGYPTLPSEQIVEFNILLDLFLGNDEVELGTFFRPERSSVLGRLFDEAPDLEGVYVRVLSKLIKQGYIKARKDEPTE